MLCFILYLTRWPVYQQLNFLVLVNYLYSWKKKCSLTVCIFGRKRIILARWGKNNPDSEGGHLIFSAIFISGIFICQKRDSGDRQRTELILFLHTVFMADITNQSRLAFLLGWELSTQPSPQPPNGLAIAHLKPISQPY